MGIARAAERLQVPPSRPIPVPRAAPVAGHTVRAVRRDLGPVMEQMGNEEIRERPAGIVRRLRPGRGHRPPVLSHQPEPGNEEERA